MKIGTAMEMTATAMRLWAVVALNQVMIPLRSLDRRATVVHEDSHDLLMTPVFERHSTLSSLILAAPAASPVEATEIQTMMGRSLGQRNRHIDAIDLGSITGAEVARASPGAIPGPTMPLARELKILLWYPIWVTRARDSIAPTADRDDRIEQTVM